MTGIRIHQCPQCELRFTSRSELEHHLADDHRPRPADISNPMTAQPPATQQPSQPEPTAERTLARPANPARSPWLVVAAAMLAGLVLLIVLGQAVAAWIVGVLLVTLAVLLGRRMRRNARAALRG